MICPSDPKAVEFMPRGQVRLDAVADQLATLQLDLMLADSREQVVRVADHLRMVADQVIRCAERINP